MSGEAHGERLLRLADGRRLAWAERGDPGGFAVIELHGNPGCRLAAFDDSGRAAAAGARLISFDRAGIGGSDPAPPRSVAEAAPDALELADALGLERFAVLGYSVGGAYAAALAAAAPGRVSRLALVSSVVPLGEGGLGEIGELGREWHWRLAERTPGALALAYRAVGRLSSRAPGLTRRIAAVGLSEPDRAVARRPGTGSRALAIAAETGRRGGRGMVEDMRAAMRPWGFALGSVPSPTSVWQGDEDASIPLAWGERLAEAIPGASLRRCPGEGHYLIADRLAEILGALRE